MQECSPVLQGLRAATVYSRISLRLCVVSTTISCLPSPQRSALTSISAHDFLNKKWKWSKSMLMSPPGVFPIQKAMDELVLMSLTPAPPHSPDEWLRRLGTLPLLH